MLESQNRRGKRGCRTGEEDGGARRSESRREEDDREGKEKANVGGRGTAKGLKGEVDRSESAETGRGREKVGRKEEGKDEERPIGPCGRRKRCE